MHIKSIVAGAAIALAATVGSAYAAEQFSTLEGIPAVAMAPAEADAIRGANIGLLSTDPGVTLQPIPPNGFHGGPFSNGGLIEADSNSDAIEVIGA